MWFGSKKTGKYLGLEHSRVGTAVHLNIRGVSKDWLISIYIRIANSVRIEDLVDLGVIQGQCKQTVGKYVQGCIDRI